MTNFSLPTDSSCPPNARIEGIPEIRQETALIARGFSVKCVAKKLKLSESRNSQRGIRGQ